MSKVAMRTEGGAKPAFMVAPFRSTSEGSAWIPGYEAAAVGGGVAAAAAAPPHAAVAARGAVGGGGGGAPRQIVLKDGSFTTSVSLLRILSHASLEIYLWRVRGGVGGGLQSGEQKRGEKK